MTATELYQTFSIQSAEYSLHDKPEDLARKIMENSSLSTAKISVVYTSGTATSKGDQAMNNGQVLYSY